MKVVFTGGGTGGHFYPLIAIAQELYDEAVAQNVAGLELYYFADKVIDSEALLQSQMQFKLVPAGKLRAYTSWKNLRDVFVMGAGILKAIWELYKVFPDVVIAKGGYASFPTLLAAKLLKIPVIIHESDSTPGRVTKWAGGFARYVATSYASAAKEFVKHPDRVAHIGQPIRRELRQPTKHGAAEFLGLVEDLPTVVVFGGSLGAQKINDIMISSLPELLNSFQVIHQTGKANFESVVETTDYVLADHKYKNRYKPFAYLNPLAIGMAGGAASVIITRAGSQLFEFAAWEIPTIIIPRTNSVGDHNRKNAYHFARAGGAIVIEENNLTPHLLVSEINRITSNKDIAKQMSKGMKSLYGPGAAAAIAKAAIYIALEHERS